MLLGIDFMLISHKELTIVYNGDSYKYKSRLIRYNQI